MSDAQTLIEDGDLGSDVRDNLRGLQTRYNNSWRQILALSTTGTSKEATRYFYTAAFGASLVGGGGCDWVANYIAAGITFSSFLWTVGTTGTYAFAWRNWNLKTSYGGTAQVSVNASRNMGIGIWVGTAYYELQNMGLPKSTGTGNPTSQYDNTNGISCLDLTAGQIVRIGSACLYGGSTSTYGGSGRIHNQGASNPAKCDVYLLESGA